MLPHVVLWQPVPARVQVTPPFAVPSTEALNCCVILTATFVLDGFTLTLICPDTVTVAEADLELSATLVAVTFTVAGEGGTAGAEYTAESPLDDREPQAAPLQPEPLKLQFTLVFELPVTVALNCCVAPLTTLALVGESETATAVGREPTAIVMEAWAVAIGDDASRTSTVKVDVPASVGVPAIVPEEGVRARPAGSVPETTLHMYGSLPPAAPREASYPD